MRFITDNQNNDCVNKNKSMSKNIQEGLSKLRKCHDLNITFDHELKTKAADKYRPPYLTSSELNKMENVSKYLDH